MNAIPSHATFRAGLSIVATAASALALVGCADPPAAATPASRVEGVSAVASDIDQVLADVCDVAHTAERAPAWQFPDTTSPPVSHPGKWTWVNFWATWCHPCLEELPMLGRTLSTGPVGLVFVSTDANDDELSRFRRERGFNTPSPRLSQPNGLGEALTRVGFRGASSLPVHVLVDPQQRVRCVRAGLVEARHVERVLGALGHATTTSRIR